MLIEIKDYSQDNLKILIDNGIDENKIIIASGPAFTFDIINKEIIESFHYDTKNTKIKFLEVETHLLYYDGPDTDDIENKLIQQLTNKVNESKNGWILYLYNELSINNYNFTLKFRGINLDDIL